MSSICKSLSQRVFKIKNVENVFDYFVNVEDENISSQDHSLKETEKENRFTNKYNLFFFFKDVNVITRMMVWLQIFEPESAN